MSQQQKLEKVLDLLLSENSDQAAEILHQIIVEKARVIYESIVEEEDDEQVENKDELDESDEVGGEPNKEFTDEIKSDKDEIETDEENDGEADDEADDEFGSEEDLDTGADDEFGGEEDDASTEERVEDLESQLAELRAEFDALMGEELQEPQHADLAGEFGGEEEVEPAGDEFGGEEDMPDFGGEEKVVGEVVATMFEKKNKEKLEKAKEAKKGEIGKKKPKVDEETKFLNAVADTGQKGTAKLVGTGKDTPLGAEQDKAPFTRAPSKPNYGGHPTKIGSGTGGEYGKWNGDSAKDDTPSDNVSVKPKNSSTKADTTPKYTGGKAAGEGLNKSPLSKRPTPTTVKK